MIVSPSEYDPLAKLIKGYNSLDVKKPKKIISSSYDFPQSYYLKIKSRLLLEDKS